MDVAVPLGSVVSALVNWSGSEQLLTLQRRNGAHLIITHTIFARVVQDRMNVQRRCRWVSTQLAQTLNELLLQLIAEVVLLAEADHPTFAHVDGKITQQFVRIGRLQQVINDVGRGVSLPMTGVTSSNSNTASRAPLFFIGRCSCSRSWLRP